MTNGVFISGQDFRKKAIGYWLLAIGHWLLLPGLKL